MGWVLQSQISTLMIDPTHLDADSKFILKRLLVNDANQQFFDDKNILTGMTQDYTVPASYPAIDGQDEHVNVHLTHSLVKYPRKNHREESRYAVCTFLASGGEGVIYSSTATLFFQKGVDGNVDLVCKPKTKTEKIRIVKQLHPHLDVAGLPAQDDRRENLKAIAEFNFMKKVDMPGLKEAILTNDDSRSALIMHRIQGKELFDYLDAAVDFTVDQLVDLSILICDAVSKVHQAGIIHRDLKLENIIVNIDSQNNVTSAVVIDFGLSKWKNAVVKESVGTLSYVSPEAMRGQTTDEKSDVFSLGWVMYFVWQMHTDHPAHSKLNFLHKMQVKNILQSAWENHDARPSVAAIREVFAKIKQERMEPQLSSIAIPAKEKKRKCIIC